MAMKEVQQAGGVIGGVAAASFALQAKTTITATTSNSDEYPITEAPRTLVFILRVFSMDRTDGDETADVWITTRDGEAVWDLVHYPQIATTGEKIFVAKVVVAGVLPQLVTATTAANEAALTVFTGATNAKKSIAANAVRHGAVGAYLSHEVTIAGTTPSFVYSIRCRLE